MYKFDVALSAKTAMKERVVWMLYLGLMFFLLYGSANQYASLTAPHPSLFFGWEHKIPFIESFIVPYMASDLMFVLVFLLPYTRLELRILALRVFAIVTFSVLIFVVFPLQFGFEKPEPEQFTFLFNILSADLPFNQAPSLHVSFAIVLWYSMQEKIEAKWLRVVLAVWFGLIALSTLFVYQHHCIDLPTGALVGFLAVYFISKKKENRVLRAFTTPRSLKMALYYLVASALFMLLAFNVSVWFLYPFISLFLVSVFYAFGLHEMFSKYRFFHFLLLPYYAGNYLSYCYYKPKLELMVKVKEGVYFGRFPMFEEYAKVKEQGIKSILNLAWEQPKVEKISLYQKRLPLLDQIIPNPKQLHEAVLFIEEHKKEGVFVHCALGLSRSVLVISAWLLYMGHSRDEVEKIMQKIRPNYVKSEYMGIALDIYEKNYL
jgi:membrane-associated phospholipid phosphatase